MHHLLERVKFPIYAQSRCNALSDRGKQSEDLIARAARIGKVLLDVEERVLFQ